MDFCSPWLICPVDEIVDAQRLISKSLSYNNAVKIKTHSEIRLKMPIFFAQYLRKSSDVSTFSHLFADDCFKDCKQKKCYSPYFTGQQCSSSISELRSYSLPLR